jgi:2-polyprenyl-3-methyl-5-hydroxy-6-metoxy-1,4-benzoquinol methylase
MLTSTKDDVEWLPCNLCGCQDFEYLFDIGDQRFDRAEIFKLVRCKSCGLACLSPRPKASSLQEYYPVAYFDQFRDADYESHYEHRAQYVERATAASKSRRLLDIGCANGAFPRFMRDRGWTVEGTEVATGADAITDFPVYHSLGEILQRGNAHYDAISAWSVLEYMPDPSLVFGAVSELLTPGGAWIVVTPNFDSITNQGLRRYDAPRQLYCFSPRTIIAFSQKFGLSVESVSTDSRFFMKAPKNWLRYYIRQAIGLDPLPWNQHPEGRLTYARRHNMLLGPCTNARYALTHPLTALDRALEPLFQKYQEWMGTYGFATFIIRKSVSSVGSKTCA